MPISEIDKLIQLLSKLPGLGPRSGRRAALALMKRRDALLLPLVDALERVADTVRACSTCGNLDDADPCAICRDPRRDPASVCVVADVADLWALERANAFKGRYHVLGGVLSALDGARVGCGGRGRGGGGTRAGTPQRRPAAAKGQNRRHQGGDPGARRHGR